MQWEQVSPIQPLDPVFTEVQKNLPKLTNDELIRVFKANGFSDPVFEETFNQWGLKTRRCTVLGPDGERHLAGGVFAAIVKAERLERLCQDRGEVVLRFLKETPSWKYSSETVI